MSGIKLLSDSDIFKDAIDSLVQRGGIIAVDSFSIGLFSQASSRNIGADTNLVQTTGYNIVRVGGGLYVFNPSIDAAYVAANPRTTFLSANGRGFELVGSLVQPEMFGAAGDGTTDDTVAIQAAINYAGKIKAGCISFSRQTYLISGSLTLTYPGIKFQGESQSYFALDYGTNLGLATILKYTGNDVLFTCEAGDGQGGWEWSDLGFLSTSYSGTLFRLGNPDTPTVGSSILGCRWNNCQFYGNSWQTPSATQTGDAIRSAGLFESQIDERCVFRGWRRAVWLKASDLNRIHGRYSFNGRHIAIQRGDVTQTITFPTGNDNVIDTGYLGEVGWCGSEDAYHIWDNAFGTRIRTGEFEQSNIIKDEKAIFFFDGVGFRVEMIQMGSSYSTPLFHLGSNAQQGRLFMPESSYGEDGKAARAPIIDAPAGWDFGYQSRFYGMTIISPSDSLRIQVDRHPRIRVESTVISVEGSKPLPGPDWFSDTAGSRNRHIQHMDACDFKGTSSGRWNAPEGGVTDPNASTGYAWSLRPLSNGNQGFDLPTLIANVDFIVGDRLLIVGRLRYSGVVTTSTSTLGYKHNGTPAGGVNPSALDGAYVTYKVPVDTSGWSKGDRFCVSAFTGAPNNASTFIDCIDVYIVSADPGSASDPTINAVLDVLRRFNMIG